MNLLNEKINFFIWNTFITFPFSFLAHGADDGFTFDTSLLRGSSLNNAMLDKFKQEETIAPGIYLLDVYVNGDFVFRDDISIEQDKNGHTSPKLTLKQIQNIGLKIKPQENTKTYPLSADIKSTIDLPQLRIDLSIPQAMMNRRPRGYITENILESGESMFFMNYNLNQYHVSYKESNISDLNSTYASMNGGINLGLWRYRQISNLRYQSGSGTNFDTSRRYVQRAIYPLKSEVLLGEGFTTGHFFSGLGFRGIKLSSDERMLPDSLRGYAPTVRGVANSNARVRVIQGKNVLYETTVAPGPFSIEDLYATNYAGDLTVIVTEADGSTHSFSVPFAAVPESMRPGLSRYSFTLGKTRYVGDDDLFSELTWQRGLTNELTLNLGNQFADGYQSIMLGGVYTNSFGAFGMDTTYSHASLPDDDTAGWLMHLSYSKTFQPFNTTLSIAGYRYSTDGYREMGDVLGLRKAAKNGDTWSSTTYRQRSRFELSLNQNIGDLGNLTMSGSIQDYRDSRNRDKQLQFGWGKIFHNGVALNLSVTKSRTLSYAYNYNDQYDYGSRASYSNAYKSQTTTALSLTFPLGRKMNSPSVSVVANNTRGQGSSYQTALSGNVGDDNPVSYGVNFSTDNTSHQNIWGGNLQTRLPYANVTGSASTSQQYRQGSMSLQGAAVVHRGGITLGPYVGDSFALIDAPGARGAKIVGGQGSKIDYFGYALAPSLTPYHYNTVALDPQGMNNKVELEDGHKRIAPYAGATVRVKFNTINGQAILITAKTLNNQIIPMGTSVLDSDGKEIGMVGQANQVYLRSVKQHAKITLKWGNQDNQKCNLEYDLPTNLDAPVALLDAQCR